MKSATFVSFKTLKERVSMEAILRHYGLLDDLEPRGKDGLTGTCPIHEGVNPTQFRVSLSKNCWNCFGCGRGGNMLDFVMAMEEKPLREAALLVQQWFSEMFPTPEKKGSRREQPKDPKDRTAEGKYRTSDNRSTKPQTSEPSPPTPASQDPPPENRPLPFQNLQGLDARHPYLRERGFDSATMEHFGVGYCTKGICAGRVAIPVHNREGDLVAYVGCSVEDGAYTYPANFRKDAELYNLHRVTAGEIPPDGVLLVADFFDVFRLYEAGYGSVVGLMGEEMGPRQEQLLIESFPEGTTLRLFGERQSDWALPIVERLVHTFRIHIVWRERNGISPQDLSTDQIWEILNP